MSWLKRGYAAAEEVRHTSVEGMASSEAVTKNGWKTDVKCPQCDTKHMVIRVRRADEVPFLACEDFGCKGAVSAWGRHGEVTPSGDPTEEPESAADFWDDWSWG